MRKMREESQQKKIEVRMHEHMQLLYSLILLLLPCTYLYLGITKTKRNSSTKERGPKKRKHDQGING